MLRAGHGREHAEAVTMTTEQTILPGWYVDPSGQHPHRYWDGASWTDQVSGRAEEARRPARRGMRWFEPVLFVGFWALWWVITFVVAFAVSAAVIGDQIALTQAQADLINADAMLKAQLAAVVVGLVIGAIVAARVGYRPHDTFLLLVPIAGTYFMVKWLWRTACLDRRYWSVTKW
jgi:hypothetical protein